MINSFTSLAQNTDSLYQLNLRLFINEYHFLDSAYTSALNEIQLSDSALAVQFEQIQDLKLIRQKQESTNSVLRQKIAELSESGLKWYHYGGASILILTIGFLLGIITN